MSQLPTKSDDPRYSSALEWERVLHPGENMIVTLVLLTFVAFVAAIGAIYRIQDRQKMSLQFDVQEVVAPAAQKPQLQPDLDLERTISVEATEIEEPAPVADKTETQPKSPQANSTEAPDFSLTVAPFATQPETEIPLAASLGVTDVLNPQIINSPHLDLDHSDLPQREEHHSPSVLEEVTQLEGADELMARLARQAEDSNSTVRATVAATLGEMAVQGQNRDRAIALLNQLSQDVDPVVRTQAATSLGSIPLDIA